MVLDKSKLISITREINSDTGFQEIVIREGGKIKSRKICSNQLIQSSKEKEKLASRIENLCIETESENDL